MFRRRVSISAVRLSLAFGAGAAFAEGPDLGRRIAPADIAAWDISILPDGTGLPPGGGTPAQGARIYAQKCVMCHGEGGKGGVAAAVGGGGPIDRIEAVEAIRTFWGDSTTPFRFHPRPLP